MPLFLQLLPLQLDPAKDALEVRLWQQPAEPVGIHPVQVGGEAVDFGLERLEFRLQAALLSGVLRSFLCHGQQFIWVQIRLAHLPHLGDHRIGYRFLLDGVAGADARFGEALIGAADEVQYILSPGVFPVEDRQRVAALVAEDQPFQQEVIGPAPGVPAAVHQHPHLLKGLSVHQGVVGTLHHHPVGRVLLQALFGLIADLHAAPLYHVADVGLILEHVGDSLTAPQAGVGAGLCHWEMGVGGRGGHALLVQEGRDVPAAHAGEGQGENPPHDRRHFLVNDDLVFLRGVHLVAVYRLAADELPLPLLIPLDALDLLGDILCVHVVHDGPEGGDVVGGGVHAGVDAVQQGDVPHPVLREVPIHVVAGQDVVAAQTGEILSDDHVDLFSLDVRGHPLEGRPVEAGSAPAVVYIGVIDAQLVLLHKLPQQGFLVLDALGWSFALILL